MAQTNNCPECGAELAPSAPRGLCPACLLKRGLETNTAGYTAEAPSVTQWAPPGVAELAARFPELEVARLLGRGGMGAVYQARQKNLDRVVALKILPPEMAHDPAFAQRFAREAQAMAKLNHPHIVAIHEFGQRAGWYYFLMEFVDGVSLRGLLNSGHIAPKEALAIVPQICDALQYAHDQGIVHRDIKPENILLNKQGQVKIADFGLAKLMARPPLPPGEGRGEGAGADIQRPGHPGLGPTEPPQTPETMTTEKVMGTPQYMAPEQLEHPAEVDHRADIYSLGVVFYQMLTGELPLGRFAPPSRKVHIDVRLDEIVLRALEREPSRRYQQVSQVKTEVETVIASSAGWAGTAAAPASPPAASSVAADAAAPARSRLGRGLLWFARISGTVWLAIVLLFVFGEGLPNVFHQPAHVVWEFCALALMAAGMVAGWFSAGAAASLVLFGWLIFHVAEGRPHPIWPLDLGAALGLLYVAARHLLLRPGRRQPSRPTDSPHAPAPAFDDRPSDPHSAMRRIQQAPATAPAVSNLLYSARAGRNINVYAILLAVIPLFVLGLDPGDPGHAFGVFPCLLAALLIGIVGHLLLVAGRALRLYAYGLPSQAAPEPSWRFRTWAIIVLVMACVAYTSGWTINRLMHADRRRHDTEGSLLAPRSASPPEVTNPATPPAAAPRAPGSNARALLGGPAARPWSYSAVMYDAQSGDRPRMHFFYRAPDQMRSEGIVDAAPGTQPAEPGTRSVLTLANATGHPQTQLNVLGDHAYIVPTLRFDGQPPSSLRNDDNPYRLLRDLDFVGLQAKGRETLDGRELLRYELPAGADNTGPANCATTIWADPATKRPVRMKAVGHTRWPNGREMPFTQDLRDLRFDEALDESLFTWPDLTDKDVTEQISIVGPKNLDRDKLRLAITAPDGRRLFDEGDLQPGFSVGLGITLPRAIAAQPSAARRLTRQSKAYIGQKLRVVVNDAPAQEVELLAPIATVFITLPLDPPTGTAPAMVPATQPAR